MNSQELFTIDENTGEIVPIVQSTQQQTEQPQIQQQGYQGQFQNGFGANVPQQHSRQIQSQSTTQFRSNQVAFRQNQNQNQQQKIQVPVPLPKPIIQPQFQRQPQPQPQPQLQRGFSTNNPQQNNVNNVSYKNWKNTNMNNFNKMVQPSSNNIVQPSQQPMFNQSFQPTNTQFVPQQNNTTVGVPTSSNYDDSQNMYQFDENQLYEQPQSIPQSNRLKNGSFIGRTNVQTNYNVNYLPKGGSLAIRKARTGKNSEDIYL
jgi:hypothetical protein